MQLTATKKEIINTKYVTTMEIIRDFMPSHVNRPYILTEDKIEIMQRYRIYVNAYNKKVKTLNDAIESYNRSVIEFIETHNLSKQAAIAQTNFENAKEGTCKRKWLSIEEFNNLVAAANTSMKLLQKKKHRTIKQAQERTFEIILWLYNRQFRKLRERLESLPQITHLPFPKAKVTSTGIAFFEKEGVPRMLLSSRTVRNHIYLMRDAGILKNYTFRGNKKPVEFFINEHILIFRDTKKTTTENQSISNIFRKIVPNKGVDTRANKEKLKKIGNVDNHCPKAERNSFATGKNKIPHKIPTNDNPQKKEKQYAGKPGGGENFQLNYLSEYLRDQIQHRSEFLFDLTDAVYANFSYHDQQMQRRLEIEATKGALAKEEFRELLLQLFIKTAAPIWNDKPVFYGSWHRALEQIDDSYLRNPNGSVPGKRTLLYLFDLLRYRIKRAKQFFKKKKNYCIYFPCIYFDPTRKLPTEGGFAYTLEWLKKHQKYKDERATRQQQRATKAGARRRQMTAEEKVRRQLKRYVNGAISLPQIYSYIESNKSIPNYFISEVPRLLNILTHKEFELYV